MAHALGVLALVQPVSASEPSAFEETQCDLPGLTPELAERFRCGFVRVPRVYSGHAPGEFRLFVAIARSPRQPAEPDPVVIMAGGPGNSATQVAALVGPDFHSLPIGPRDVIFIDQRGTGRSEPRFCEPAPSDLLAPFAADRTTDQLVAQTAATFLECLNTLTRHGVPPDAWGTHVTAEDFEQVRKALRVSRWNALSVSYGTSVAMELATRYPETLRLLMLDSVLPPDPLPLDTRTSFLLARDALFSLCARNASCARAYPDLPQTYARALSRLEVAPVVIPVSEQFGLPGNRFVLNRGDFELIVFLALYHRPMYGELPALIRAAAEGRAEPFGPLIELIAQTVGSLSVETYAAVMCRDMPRMQAAEVPQFGFDVVRLVGVCSQWTKPGPLPRVPVESKIPTLIFAGTMDPITPPVYGATVARQIGSSARLVLMQEFGHAPVATEGVRPGVDTCGERILASFLDDPEQPLDTSCASEPAPIAFE